MTTDYAPERIINYAFLLGGITAFIFGLILLIRQDQAIGVVMLLLGLWWLIQGAFLVFSVFVDKADMWWKLFVGVVGVTAGVVVLANPVQTGEVLGSTLAFVLGVMGLLMGVAALVGGFRGAGMGAIVFGIVSGAIGILIMVYPSGSFSAFVTILAIILMVQGVAAIGLAITAK